MGLSVNKVLVFLIFVQFLLLFTALIECLVNASPCNVSIAGQIIIFACLAISILLSFFISREVVKAYRKEALLATREAAASSVQSLTEAMKLQNQDFINHIDYISALVQKGRFDQLASYLEQVSGEITVLNDILKIDNPIIGALLKTKMTEGRVRGLRLNIDVSASLANEGKRALDLARIIANLVDNAFDALLSSEESPKIVSIKIYETGPLLQLEVSNRGPVIPPEVQEHIFKPGYTEKGEGHSGLGLHIVKTLAEKLFGTVTVSSDEKSGTKFVVMLPKV